MSVNGSSRQLAYEEGCKAFRNGKTLADNPFRGASLWCEWKHGWEDSKDDEVLEQLRKKTEIGK